MLPEPGGIDELLPALLALVPLPPPVGVRGPRVPLQVVLVGEAAVALVAGAPVHDGALLVPPLVVLQELEVAERALAEAAGVRGRRGGAVFGHVLAAVNFSSERNSCL